MKPLKLEFEAFLSYKNKTVIDFTKFDNSLFLIDGNTGAGKTTIFDAMCFALYGETTDETRSKKYKSDFANDKTECSVTFEFEQEGKTYTITRKPAQLVQKEKVKKGADPFKAKKEEVSFTVDGKTYTNIKETNKEIINVVKFDVKQFRQTMMIAQDKFTDLIRADSNKRVELLRNILQTENFGLFTKALQNKKNEYSNNIEETNIKIDDKLKQFETNDETLKGKLSIDHPSNNDFDTISPLIENEIENDESKKDKLEKDKTNVYANVENKTKEIENAKKDNEHLEQLNKSKADFDDLKSQENDYKEKEEKITVYGDSSKVLDAYNLYIDKENELKEKKDNLAKATQDSKDLEPKYNTAKTNFDTIPALESEKELNLDKINECNKTLDAFNDKEKAQKDLDNKSKELENKKEDFDKNEKKINQLNDDIQHLQEYIDNNSDNGSKLVDIDNKVENKKKDINELEKHQEEYDNYLKEEKSLEILNNSVKTKGTDFDIALNKFLDAKRLYELDIAGVLASELKSGEECPVCGSKEHPHPHVCTSSSHVTKEDVDELEKKKEDTKNDLVEARSKVKAKEASLETTINSIYANLKLANGENIQLFIDTKLKEFNSELDTLNVDKESLLDIKNQIDSNNDLINSKNKEIETLSKKKNTLEKEINELKNYISKINGSLETANKLTEGKVKSDIENEKSSLENSNNELQKTIDQFRKTFQNLYTKKATIEKEIAILNKEITECETKKNDFYDEFNNLLNKSILKDIEKIKECVNSTTEIEIKDLDKQVEEFNKKIYSSEAIYKANVNNYGKLVKVDITSLEAEKTKLDNDYKDLDNQFNNLKAKLSNNKSSYNQYKDLYKSSEEKTKKFKALDDLYSVASGQVSGTEKTDFEQYYQSLVFKNILAIASRKLEEMTSGKFTMQKHDSSSSSKSKVLDIDILDTSTGKLREASSLSGGETFMAALSLALGLADISKSTSGAREINCMFIDEGFGSLDNESLNDVIKVLKDLSSKNNRMIGIISHVETIGEQVSKKIKVTKTDENGSTLEIDA